jgi:hypothetical protein
MTSDKAIITGKAQMPEVLRESLTTQLYGVHIQLATIL